MARVCADYFAYMSADPALEQNLSGASQQSSTEFPRNICFLSFNEIEYMVFENYYNISFKLL